MDRLAVQAMEGLARERQVFGLPQRFFWRPPEGLDLSVATAGGRTANPLGPAAGPHTQLAPNIVTAWLAGARAIELKTVQVMDRIEVPRPCIDAPGVGYNVEWSQELRLEQSAMEYAKAWTLIHLLDARGVAPAAGTRFEASVGYDLEGIRSDAVAAFIDSLTDGAALLRRARGLVPPRYTRGIETPDWPRIADTVTLSTFHGCPPEEIEHIVEHLFARHGVNVVVKLNPTLLGFEAVEALLRAHPDGRDVVLERAAFEHDLGWEVTLPLLLRLETAARRRGLAFGVKLTNTLVVRNTRGRLAGERVYLSGPPLHPIAIVLAARLAEATQGRLPLSFSGGVDATNFADTVASGLAPVTTCTDLLRPNGYRRLAGYLRTLEAAMRDAGVTTVEALVRVRAGDANAAGSSGAGTAVGGAAASPAVATLAAYAARLAAAPVAPAEPAPPAERPTELGLFDCASCNRCVLVCPNGAFMKLDIPPTRIETFELRIEHGRIVQRPLVFETTQDAQWAYFADACNACGHCDTWCPEAGGPWRRKPALSLSEGPLVARDPAVLAWSRTGASLRLEGRDLSIGRTPDDGWRCSDRVIEAVLGPDFALREARILSPREGHVLSLADFHALRLIAAGSLASVNPVSVAAPRQG
jgi:putative selenate reductase